MNKTSKNPIKAFFSRATNADRASYIVIAIFSLTALIAAFTLTLEKFEKLQNPNAVLSCSINVVLNCSTVMESWQSHLFGFPNMVIGDMAYPVLITFAVAALMGIALNRRFLVAANIGILLGAIFAYWLFFNSLYAIQVLCPWCLVVTFSTTMILAAIMHINLRNNHFGLTKKRNASVQKFLAGGYDKVLTFGWIVLLIALVFLKFGSGLFA